MIRVPHNRLTHGAAERDAVAAVVSSGRWSCGPAVERFERALAARVGRQHAVAVGSGVGALRLALLSLGVGAGDEVIVPAYSCVALANAALACGARPVPVDVVRDAWTIDPRAVTVTPRTKAIVAVHTFGAAADVKALAGFGVPVIEDCAHGIAVGGMGSLATIAITSFYATKLIGAGEGGAVMADDPAIAAFVRRWRDYGEQGANGTRLNDKLTEFAAALAGCQMERLDEFLEARRIRAERYRTAFVEIARAGAITLPPAADRAWYRYAVEFARFDAPEAIARLGERGVDAAEPVTDWAQAGDSCPVSARAFRRVVSLPLFPTLSAEEQEMVIAAVRALAAERQ